MYPQKLRFFFVLFIFVSIFSFTPKVFASTIITTDITADTTWTQGQSPYIVQNDTHVASGITLTINPGVVVKFSQDKILWIDGKLLAEGVSDNKIVFTSIYDDSYGGDTGDGNLYNTWSIIFTQTSSPSTFKYIVEKYAYTGLQFSYSSNSLVENIEIDHSSRGILIVESDTTIKNINITNAGIGLIILQNSHVNGSNIVIENVFESAITVHQNSNYQNFPNIYSSAELENVSLKNGTKYGISVSQNSRLKLKNSEISGFSDSGINCNYGSSSYSRSAIDVTNTKIENNKYGIYSFYCDDIIKNNSIINNLNYGFFNVYNSTFHAVVVDAKNNFWGSPTGPYHATNPSGLGNKVSDGILFSPWLLTDPLLPPPPCCSSVLFLPGIKGSVLEKGSDTLWPPTFFSNDISQLALTQDGESVNDIHTVGILNTFKGTPIYAPFSSFMNNLVLDETMEEWLPLAYDWRFSPEKILNNGIKTKTETLDVIGEIEKLAAKSKTGKITIVTHSMGGLLGKAIIKKLSDEGKDSLIDSFVMVGTPQLGTPQAIAAILHGDSEGIAAGFIVNPIGIRRIAQNMPSAYNLLPSPRYFTEVSDPVFIFNESAPFTQTWRDFWGTTINTFPSFLSFITGTGVTRTKPAETELKDPEVLRPELMTDAISFHNMYDSYQLPENIRVVQVAGWGSPTTKAVEYKMYHGYPNYETKFTVEGDRTVVYPSAISSVADETYFFDIGKYRKNENITTQHRDLLSSGPVQTLLMSVIKDQTTAESNFIRKTKPQVTDLDDQLIVGTHSPVILGVYDQFGNFTGIDPNQDLSADVLSIKEDIPGSVFSYTSESQNIFLPKDGNYNFIYKGTGNGPTTVTIENFIADTTTPIVSYTDIPTTPNTVATFTVQSSTPENTVIALDANGDGVTDSTISADNTELSLNELIILIKEKIYTLAIKDKLKQNLLKQILNLEKKIDNKKQKNVKILANLQKKISKQEMKGKINTADATELANLLDILESQAEDISLDSGILTDLKVKIQSLNIKQNLKNDLLKRVGMLEKKQQLVKTLSNLSKSIVKKADKGKIADSDAQALIDLLSQIQGVI